MIIYKKIFILGIFSYFVNISFLASENDKPENPKYKLIFLGDQSVGKSCILNRFMYDTFTEDYQATIGLDFQNKKDCQIDNQDIHLLLYDTSGQEKFKSLIPMYTRDADIILLVYDVTSKDSFIHLSNWLKIFTDSEIDIKDKIFAIVGNKTDLNDRREVNAEEGENYAKEHDFIFLEVSAKTRDGIKNLFDVILKEMLKKKPKLLPQPQPQVIKIQKIDKKIEPKGGKKDCCFYC